MLLNVLSNAFHHGSSSAVDVIPPNVCFCSNKNQNTAIHLHMIYHLKCARIDIAESAVNIKTL